MSNRPARKALRKYFYRTLEPRIANVRHLMKWLRKRGFKLVKR